MTPSGTGWTARYRGELGRAFPGPIPRSVLLELRAGVILVDEGEVEEMPVCDQCGEDDPEKILETEPWPVCRRCAGTWQHGRALSEHYRLEGFPGSLERS